MKIKFFVKVIILIILTSCNKNKKDLPNQINKPNIVYILADDLGYGDLSCYGQTRFSTPNIDALAQGGVLFTQHYSGSTVCAPSRSSLMTGLHTGHTFVRGNKEVRPEGQIPIPDSTYTISKLLKEHGYATGAFGKWGLGYPGSEGDPLNQGFDTFYGFNCQRLAHNYYPYHLWDNDKMVLLEGNSGIKQEQYAPELIHQKALQFIDKNKDRPFFLYYPSVIPHAELFAPNNYMDQFLGKLNPEKVFNGIDEGDKYKNGGYGTQEHGHAAFAAMVNLLDDQVGEIVQKIKDLGLEEHTIFIFTSDNGPHQEGGADPDYFDSNGILKGYKRDLFEGGIRVPLIVKWRGKIKEGRQTNHISAFWDVMPTFANILNTKLDTKTDGISFLPTLLDTGKQQKHDYLYWEFHELKGRQAIRKDNWKLVKYNVKEIPKYFLFDLDTDAGETNNLSETNPGKLNELIKILENARTDSEVFKF
ncbi:arylsulfatase [Litoribaculum gwangyangense]|uniref:Arylsulfatase n=1 Tax=Litoribaculum gwangyangense TaxID=1130722 RepID=A0ABP9CF43_9FLAO